MARPADPQRREAILRAARDVFLEQGYSEARLSEIARRAGIVPSTLYLYFASKEEMAHAMVSDIRLRTIEALAPILEHLRGRDDIAQLVQTLLTPVAVDPDIFRLAQLDSALRNVRFHPSRPAHGPAFQHLIGALESQMDQGYLRRYDPMALLDTLFGFLRWLVEVYATLAQDEQERYKAVFTDMLCAMLLP